MIGTKGTFDGGRGRRIERMSRDGDFGAISRQWLLSSFEHRYGYNFTWLGRPIIKYPADIVAMQEILVSVRPDVILETGVAHGGSILFSASMLQLIGKEGLVVGVEQNLLPETVEVIRASSLSSSIELIEGNSTSLDVVRRVRTLVPPDSTVVVFLDSDHSHDHVLEELRVYAPFVSRGSYIVAFDTFIEFLGEPVPNRTFGPGNSPMTAVREFVTGNDDFEIDTEFNRKLVMSEAINGYLRRRRVELPTCVPTDGV